MHTIAKSHLDIVLRQECVLDSIVQRLTDAIGQLDRTTIICTARRVHLHSSYGRKHACEEANHRSEDKCPSTLRSTGPILVQTLKILQLWFIRMWPVSEVL